MLVGRTFSSEWKEFFWREILFLKWKFSLPSEGKSCVLCLLSFYRDLLMKLLAADSLLFPSG
jgi:hypothetical protein